MVTFSPYYKELEAQTSAIPPSSNSIPMIKRIWVESSVGKDNNYLDLHRVFSLGLFCVQQLNGHDHLVFPLKEHHLQRGRGHR